MLPILNDVEDGASNSSPSQAFRGYTPMSAALAPETRMENEEPPRSRRALLKASALAAVAALVPSRARAQKIRKPPATNPNHGYPVVPDESPVAPIEWATDTTRLLRRCVSGRAVGDPNLG